MSHACYEINFTNNIPGSYLCLFRNQFKLKITLSGSSVQILNVQSGGTRDLQCSIKGQKLINDMAHVITHQSAVTSDHGRKKDFQFAIGYCIR
jgi:hypothetical protein